MIYHGTDDQGNTYATLYAHMNSTPPVSVGQSVSQGDVIGYVAPPATPPATTCTWNCV